MIFLFSWCGGWLDREHPHPTIDYRVLLTLIGVAVSMTSVILQVNRMNRK
ncbi:ATPase F0F1 [Flavobacterium sp. HJ-32-4]|nr:ATPase F0F1 [Flavobacterium sp. HJ-32-4]UMY66411.1 ATPase F0F1 [Flavobacterium sp. HJ-32-4]